MSSSNDRHFTMLLKSSRDAFHQKRSTITDILNILNIAIMSAEIQTERFNDLYARVTSFRPPLLHPSKTKDASLTDQIASLYLHPALEAGLHILNYDLPSAHFLVRKMQSLPAQEGMFLHGVLHRIEGDYPNARAWYSDVNDTDIMKKVWGNKGEGVEGGSAWKFINDVQKLDERIKKKERGMELECEQQRLEEVSRREIMKAMEYCWEKIGLGEWKDARGAYVESSEKIKKAGRGQTTGNAQRKF